MQLPRALHGSFNKKTSRAPAFFGKAEMGPIRFQREKFAGSLCLRRPRFVRVTSFRPNRGSKHRLSHDLTPCRDALQVFSASLRKPARRYGYRGLKIFTSLSLRFQDFQRTPRFKATRNHVVCSSRTFLVSGHIQKLKGTRCVPYFNRLKPPGQVLQSDATHLKLKGSRKRVGRSLDIAKPF